MNREVYVKEYDCLQLVAVYQDVRNGFVVRLFRHIRIDHNSELSFYYSAFRAYSPLRVMFSFSEVKQFHDVLIKTGFYSLDYLERSFELELAALSA